MIKVKISDRIKPSSLLDDFKSIELRAVEDVLLERVTYIISEHHHKLIFLHLMNLNLARLTQHTFDLFNTVGIVA